MKNLAGLGMGPRRGQQQQQRGRGMQNVKFDPHLNMVDMRATRRAMMDQRASMIDARRMNRQMFPGSTSRMMMPTPYTTSWRGLPAAMAMGGPIRGYNRFQSPRFMQSYLGLWR